MNRKSHDFKVTLNVDPKDKFERSLNNKTPFWRRFNSGNNKYIILVTNKGEEDDIPIPPESYKQTFGQL